MFPIIDVILTPVHTHLLIVAGPGEFGQWLNRGPCNFRADSTRWSPRRRPRCPRRRATTATSTGRARARPSRTSSGRRTRRRPAPRASAASSTTAGTCTRPGSPGTTREAPAAPRPTAPARSRAAGPPASATWKLVPWSATSCSRSTTASGRPRFTPSCRTRPTTSARSTSSSSCARCSTRTSSPRSTGRGTPFSSRISRFDHYLLC